MPEFTLRQLEYFVAVADHGTIAAGALELHVSESAVATALSELERALGVRLAVRRRAHGITLTTEGRHALALARTVLRDAREFAAGVAAGPGRGLAGPLAIGCYDTLAPTVLPRLIRGFADRFPEVALEASDGPQETLLRRLENGELDLAILYDRDLEGTPCAEPLFESCAHVLVAADHPLADSGTVSFRDLAEEPFVRLDLSPGWQHTRALMTAEGVTPRERFRTRNLEHARSLVGQGLGYTVIVQRPGTDLTHDGSRVVSLELDPPAPPVRVVIAWRRGATLSERAAAFLAFAKEACAARPDSEPRPHGHPDAPVQPRPAS